MTTNLKRRADQMHEAKTEVPSEPQYYMLHYSKIRTRVTKCDSGEGVKVEMCEPTIKKVTRTPRFLVAMLARTFVCSVKHGTDSASNRR